MENGEGTTDPQLWCELKTMARRLMASLHPEDTMKDMLQALLQCSSDEDCQEQELYETTQAFASLKTRLSTRKQLWKCHPRTILMTKKHQDLVVTAKLKTMIRWLIDTAHIPNILLETAVFDELRDTFAADTCVRAWATDSDEPIDLIILLGGDGTLLHTAALFQGRMPPVLPFALGSMGFLTPFQFRTFDTSLRTIFNGNCSLFMRMRLQCRIARKSAAAPPMFHVLNEVVLDRGPTAYVTKLEILCNNQTITRVVGDGLIIATPTGSTAYSVAAGGSMVHPDMSCFLITPICPHSLSFRPIIVPSHIELEIRVLNKAAWASMDGRHQHELVEGESIFISCSPHPVPTITQQSATDDWFTGLSRCLSWNTRESFK